MTNAILLDYNKSYSTNQYLHLKLPSSQFLKRFHEILGVLGALNLCPLAIYFPVEM
ncbi:hypothetical protein HanXRQr2_Chr06g0278441 [Helianthus annuus]|uniref:Uncharacterized protein n=1 Tax=Helianthus annuus TaxID=4232 RepID=A0A9K3IXX0_HELAN|nr:hypothetical protein HanXRQr2_Chr06g0278441 [Helianthus annuus]KAJ0917097.1 hypothetical protein HanPSC8_Chr06g0269421 [Helianthus annuus]